jgi:hypothetical protein
VAFRIDDMVAVLLGVVGSGEGCCVVFEMLEIIWSQEFGSTFKC